MRITKKVFLELAIWIVRSMNILFLDKSRLFMFQKILSPKLSGIHCIRTSDL